MTPSTLARATRATLTDLRSHGAVVTAAAVLLTVGSGARDLCRAEGIALTSLKNAESNLWPPDDCPLRQGEALTGIT